MPLLTNNDTLNKWKIKAIERNKIIAQQNKQILELEQSRDDCKLCFYQNVNKQPFAGQNKQPFAGQKATAKVVYFIFKPRHQPYFTNLVV